LSGRASLGATSNIDMTSGTQDTSPKFECRKVEVHYIYSFALSYQADQLGGPLPIDPERAIRDSRSVQSSAPLKREVGPSLKRCSIAPHLAVKQNVGWVEFPPLECRINGHAVTIDRLARLFPIGGTLCITVRLSLPDGQSIGVGTIQGLLEMTDQRVDNQVSSKPTSRLILRHDGSEVSLYSLFKQSVEEIAATLRVQQFDFVPETEVTNQTREAQSPWIVTVTEVDGDIADAFCSSTSLTGDRLQEKARRTRPYERQIAPILFRSVSGTNFDLEPAYIDPMSSSGMPGLTNLNVDARLFVLMSRRSVLCIARSLILDPAHYFLPGLLDICETVRARWHMLIVMNRMLDSSLALMQAMDLKPERKLHELVRVREWIARSLDDPGIYIVAGEALSRIYEQLQQTFRLADLRKYLFDKVDLLERVHRDRVELDWFETLPSR
jgi:hypothetical protein